MAARVTFPAFWVPELHHPATDRDLMQEAEVTIEGATVGEILAGLVQRYPGLRRVMFRDDGKLIGLISIYVRAAGAEPEDIRFLQGDDTPVPAGAEVSIVA